LHRDLTDNIFTNVGEIPGNNLDDDNNGFIDDVNGWDFVHNDATVFDNANEDSHGTHVAGSLGARGNNAVGVVGVNWNVRLLPIKALTPSGGSDAALLEAFHYAKLIRQRGVNLRVLNNSYGGQGFSASLALGIKELNDVGILFVAAAGNESLNNDFLPVYPASYDLPNVISVAASTDQNFLEPFTNHGSQSVHLAAPGEDILSTTPRGYIGSRIS
jgi:subtilisin family serine protease